VRARSSSEATVALVRYTLNVSLDSTRRSSKIEMARVRTALPAGTRACGQRRGSPHPSPAPGGRFRDGGVVDGGAASQSALAKDLQFEDSGFFADFIAGGVEHQGGRRFVRFTAAGTQCVARHVIEAGEQSARHDPPSDSMAVAVTAVVGAEAEVDGRMRSIHRGSRRRCDCTGCH